MTVKTLADQTGLQLHLLYRICKKLGIKKRNVDFGYTYMLCYDLTQTWANVKKKQENGFWRVVSFDIVSKKV